MPTLAQVILSVFALGLVITLNVAVPDDQLRKRRGIAIVGAELVLLAAIGVFNARHGWTGILPSLPLWILLAGSVVRAFRRKK